MNKLQQGRALGVVGIFFRSKAPARLAEREEHDFGKFGWFVDPDENRVELWEPPQQS